MQYYLKGKRNIAIPLRSFSFLLGGSVVEGVVYAAVTLEWNVNNCQVIEVIISNLLIEILGLYLVVAPVADLCSMLLDVAFPIHLDSL